MFSKDDKDNFLTAIESLKKDKLANLLYETGRNLLKILYTDLFPEDNILNKTSNGHIAFLIGLEGKRKSTIFLRIEQGLRKKDNFSSCYLNTKTIFESAQTKFKNIDYLLNCLPAKTINIYL